MSAIPKGPHWRMEEIPTKANTAYAIGEFVMNDGTDNVPATSAATPITLRGIVAEAKASANTVTPIKIHVPVTKDAVAEVPVGTGTLALAMEGRDIDLDDSTSVNLNSSTNDPLKIRKVLLSEDKVHVSFN